MNQNKIQSNFHLLLHIHTFKNVSYILSISVYGVRKNITLSSGFLSSIFRNFPTSFNKKMDIIFRYNTKDKEGMDLIK